MTIGGIQIRRREPPPPQQSSSYDTSKNSNNNYKLKMRIPKKVFHTGTRCGRQALANIYTVSFIYLVPY
jgi:hypothetical protein